MTRFRSRSRGGFTLMEILVALVLIGLLVGAIVPAVLNQLGRGEMGRAIEDLTAIENAARSFRVDVNRWPGDLEDLVEQPALTGDNALTGSGAYTAGLLGRWNGPYLERTTLTVGGDIVSPLGGTIRGTFVSDANFLVIEIAGLADDQIADLNATLDGDAIATGAGRVRRTGTASPYVLRYYAVPLN